MENVDTAQHGKRPSEPVVGLVLSASDIIGHQIAGLLSSARGWRMQVENRDKRAYAHISQGRLDAVVADIDASNLGGLAFLIYARRHWPSVISYAITNNENGYIKQLAYDMAGCHGFFYMSPGGRLLDMHAGMALQLQEEVPEGPAREQGSAS